MSELHPQDIELAGHDGEDAGGDVAQHLRWCARCRSVVADYAWLESEVAATLDAAADTVPVPRPRWHALQQRLSAGRRRERVGRRVSALASVALACCLMLSASPVLGVGVSVRTLPPEAAFAPAPRTAAVTGEHAALLVTPTPAIPSGNPTPAETPAFMLPPTPPQLQ